MTAQITPGVIGELATGRRFRRRGRTDSRAAAVFLTPWIIGAIGLTVGPMLASLYLSFTNYDLFTAPKWVGLDNYVRLLTVDTNFMDSARVTLFYVLVATPLKLIAALAIAMLLNRLRGGQGFYRSAFYLPSLLGTSVSIALVWRAIFGDGGVVADASSALGFDTGGWISNPSLANWTLILLSVWQFGAPMIIFLAGLKQISPELYEAASLDGAGPIRKFISVTVPMLSPVILFNLILEMIHSFQAFTPAYIVSDGRGGPVNTTLFYTLYLYQQGFSEFRMGYASAMAWMLLVAIAIVTGLLFWSSRKWVFYAGEDGR